MQPIHSSSRDYPGLDVVSLAIASDGKQIAFTATLADPPGSFATEILSVYFDTDNKPTTGMQMTYPELVVSSTRRSSRPAPTTATRAAPASAARRKGS